MKGRAALFCLLLCGCERYPYHPTGENGATSDTGGMCEPEPAPGDFAICLVQAGEVDCPDGYERRVMVERSRAVMRWTVCCPPEEAPR